MHPSAHGGQIFSFSKKDLLFRRFILRHRKWKNKNFQFFVSFFFFSPTLFSVWRDPFNWQIPWLFFLFFWSSSKISRWQGHTYVHGCRLNKLGRVNKGFGSLNLADVHGGWCKVSELKHFSSPPRKIQLRGGLVSPGVRIKKEQKRFNKKSRTKK